MEKKYYGFLICMRGGYNIIVSVINNQYREEIFEILADFQGDIYFDVNYVMDKPEELLNFVQYIDWAREENREIYLYSKRTVSAKLIEEMLNIYGIDVNGYVYGVNDEEKGVVCITDLNAGNREGLDNEVKTRKKLFIINETTPRGIIDAREKIERQGFSLENRDYTSMKWYTHSDEWLLSNLRWYKDSLVGKTTLYCQSKLGWKQYGNDGIKILVLGDSTSSETLHTENWISKLYTKLYEEKIEVVIYNAANICDDIVSNILRLLRDGYSLRPQIVISMGGINNTFYKECLNQFNEEKLIWGMKEGEFYSGMYRVESLYSFWDRNMRILRHIAEFYGACFFGFLHPMNITMEHMNVREKSLYESERHIIGAKSFSEFANDESGYINLMRLFEHKEGMYLDMCHYTDKAQNIIAEKVYDIIVHKIRKLKSECTI